MQITEQYTRNNHTKEFQMPSKNIVPPGPPAELDSSQSAPCIQSNTLQIADLPMDSRMVVEVEACLSTDNTSEGEVDHYVMGDGFECPPLPGLGIIPLPDGDDDYCGCQEIFWNLYDQSDSLISPLLLDNPQPPSLALIGPCNLINSTPFYFEAASSGEEYEWENDSEAVLSLNMKGEIEPSLFGSTLFNKVLDADPLQHHWPVE